MVKIIRPFASNVSFPFKFSISVDSPASTLCGLPTGDTASRSYLKSVSLVTTHLILNVGDSRTLLAVGPVVGEYCV
ncbi:hypothetical protein BDR07DRAFT_1393344 [Suillus spraguei]|nr:hypothetical protein BDR07DRAFT_1393344 [Suillus spraguei]